MSVFHYKYLLRLIPITGFSIAGFLLLLSFTNPKWGSFSKEMVVNIDENSRLMLKGSSNVNQFSCDCQQKFPQSHFLLETKDDGSKAVFKGSVLQIATQELNCHNKGINKDLCEALKSKQYPYIKIELTEAAQHASLGAGQWSNIDATALITITNVCRKIPLQIKGTKIIGNQYRFVSSRSVKMSDFGVKPPEALFGFIKVNDDIAINFDLLVNIVEGAN